MGKAMILAAASVIGGTSPGMAVDATALSRDKTTGGTVALPDGRAALRRGDGRGDPVRGALRHPRPQEVRTLEEGDRLHRIEGEGDEVGSRAT